MSDPWAAAQAQQSSTSAAPAAGGQQTGPASSAALGAFKSLNPGANPFASPDKINSGGGVRGPQHVDLIGRLVVLEPLEKLLDQPKPNDPNGTQDFWSTNLTVLTGGPLTIVTPAKPANGDQPALPEQANTYELPFTFPRWYAFGASFTAKLDGLAATGAPLLLGVVQRCPTGAGYRSGKTWQQATAEYDAWVEKMKTLGPDRAGAKPQFSWGLVDATPEQQALALSWWQQQNAA